MIDRSKLGFILAAVTAAAVIGGLAGAQTPAPEPSSAAAASPAPAADPAPMKGCCQGHAGNEGHDHSKCPMHADKAAGSTSEKKDAGATGAAAAKCPFMGKKAEEAKAAGSKSEVAAGYVCPMHPEVTSKTKDRCPKCGMFLEEKK